MIKAAIFDIDHTILKGHSSERIFIRHLRERGIITPRDIIRFVLTFLTRLITLNGIYIKKNKSYLKGKDVKVLEDEAGRCFRDKIMPYISTAALREIQEKKDSGYTIVLLSGTLDILIGQFKEYCKADIAIGSNLQRVNGVLTGGLEGIHPYGRGKAKLLEELALKMEIDLKGSFAYADHFSDIKFLRMVGNPVVVNAHPALWLYAKVKGWNITDF